jgi:dolichol-phosphate mannosyltransferase
MIDVNNNRPNLYVIIPVFDEEDNLPRLMRSIEVLKHEVASEFVLKIFVIDDGSKDNSVKVIERINETLDVVVISHSHNMGPGAAFRTAFDLLSDKLEPDDWVVTMEADNTSRLDTLLHMLIRRKEGYDVVLASPYLCGGGISNVNLIRLFISQVGNESVRLLLGLRGIQTFSSFLRLYRGEVILKLQQRYGSKIMISRGFECMVELLVKLVRNHASISEVEMKLDWDQRVGKSRMKIIKTIAGYIKLLFKLGIRER